MALEDQVAQLSQNVGNLVNLVSTQVNNWNNAVQNAINRLEQWKQNAIRGYPAWNLFSNPRLDKLNSDNSPKGFYWYNFNISVTATVMTDTSSSNTWWRTQGNFLRLSFNVIDASKTTNYYGKILSALCGIFPSSVPEFPNNAPIQITTVGFEYRVVSVSGNVSAKVGIDYSDAYLDLSKTSWTPASFTAGEPQKSIVWFHLWEPTAALTIDLRNIYMNLGEANYYTLGIPQLTDLSI